MQNVETLANVALICRRGPDWFRRAGTEDEPGTVLVTVLGGVRRPGVVEVPLGTPLRDVLRRCGGPAAPVQALLVGGYFGHWLGADLGVPLTAGALRERGASLGARTLAVLPAAAADAVERRRMEVTTMHERLRVDPIRCDAYGHCAELLPELVEVDDWGYPIVADEPVPAELLAETRRAVAACPRLALRLARDV